MPRRGENIYKRKDGRWEGRIWKETSIPGKRSYLSIYGKTYKEAKEKMKTARSCSWKTGKGLPKLEEAASVWIDEKKVCWKPTTCREYRYILDKHVIPWLGDARINNIDQQTMESFASLLLKEQDNGLSANYLSYICSIVIRILLHMKKKHGYGIPVPANPVIKSKKCQVILPGGQAMSKLVEYLIANSGRNADFGILVALYTGIRIGELCALTWKDIDLKEGVIYIRNNVQRVRGDGGGKNKTHTVIQTPKTSDSVRVVPISPMLLPLLEKHRQEDSRHIIRGSRNLWADPRTVQYQFRKILEECGLEHFNFHMLRHVFASRCIEKGFDVKSVSEILGHSDIRLTMELYVHSSVQQKKMLMNRFGSYLHQGDRNG